jgi:mRNA-degrading endonuclease YafQ of YafQ-DinJ toxin-antitoxin module
MIKVSWDQGFKRVYRKKVKNDAELKNRFWDAMEIFAADTTKFIDSTLSYSSSISNDHND